MDPQEAMRARWAGLGGVVAGLLAAPAGWAGVVAGCATGLAVVAALPMGRRGVVPAVALAAAAAGVLVGQARLAAIDRGAIEPPRAGSITARVDGHLVAVPRGRSEGTALIVATDAGRVQVISRRPIHEELGPGDGIAATGRLTAPADWERAWLRRQGVAATVDARTITPTGRRRSGIPGALDTIRRRAESALGRGMPAAQAALARGFVLGQDDRIDERTREEFKRSGLAHLLAVSGQNVILLIALALPFTVIAGLRLHTRLWVMVGLVCLYVPIAGAGPSIQRAGVMGVAGLLAGIAERPAMRWWAVGLAAAVTLALNPLSSADVGWQLSFAAVIGILLWTRPLTRLLARRAAPGSPRHALAQGAAMTIAATVATAPLMAHHFETVSLASLPANLLALPAVAPVMWLGMLAGFAGQIPALPVEPLNALNAPLIAYIEWVASTLAAPRWALLEPGSPGAATTVAAYVLLLAGASLSIAAAERRARSRPTRRGLVATATAAGLLTLFLLPAAMDAEPHPDPEALTITVLDVGQGDAILLEPPGADPVLVDTGPPGGGIGDELRDRGVERLSWLIITHDQSDHAAALGEVLAAAQVARLGYTRLAPARLAQARAAGARPFALAEGTEVRAGALSLRGLWPPKAILDAPAGDPNRTSFVALARFGAFSMLLTGDAEAESVPLDPGPLDVLKLAHHGSADTGLERLLARTVPRAAIASAGAGNPFGHPAAETVAAVAEAGIPLWRTDRDGDVTIEVRGERWSVIPGS